MDNAPIGLAVACPTCGARPGERCILLDPNAGWRQLPHYARTADAQGALTTAELRRRAREGAAEEAYPYVPGWSGKAISDLKREAFVKGAEWEATNATLQEQARSRVYEEKPVANPRSPEEARSAYYIIPRAKGRLLRYPPQYAVFQTNSWDEATRVAQIMATEENRAYSIYGGLGNRLTPQEGITVNVHPGAASVPRGNRRYRGQQ